MREFFGKQGSFQAERWKQLVAQTPDATLEALRPALDLIDSIPTIASALGALQLTF